MFVIVIALAFGCAEPGPPPACALERPLGAGDFPCVCDGGETIDPDDADCGEWVCLEQADGGASWELPDDVMGCDEDD